MNELIKIQNELKAPKGNYNKFGNYKYRSCEDILESVKPLLKANNCTLTLSDDIINVGARYYIKATATITNGKEEKTVTAFARESEVKKGMDDSQITGTASSYARKYALNGLFLIDDTKDADTDEYHKTTTVPEIELTDEEIDKLIDLAGKKKVPTAKLCVKYKVDNIARIRKKDYEAAIKGLEGMPDA